MTPQVVGSCAPGHVRQRHLEALEAGDVGRDPASGFGSPHPPHRTGKTIVAVVEVGLVVVVDAVVVVVVVVVAPHR